VANPALHADDISGIILQSPAMAASIRKRSAVVGRGCHSGKEGFRMQKVAALAAAASIGLIAFAYAQNGPAPAPNGIMMPEGYKDWRLISVSERTDNNTLRAILGNDIAIEAARAGNTNPWPEGAILGKIVLTQHNDPNWDAAIVPDQLRHAEFMIKDSVAYADTGGWGYARWLGAEQTPFGDNADFDQQCFGCHVPVADRDYVFTTPIAFP
jgi:hypothetical protein